MADLISILSSEEAKRLNKKDMETLYTIQAKANGEIPSDEEQQKNMSEYIKKRCEDLQGDVGYAEQMKKTFV